MSSLALRSVRLTALPALLLLGAACGDDDPTDPGGQPGPVEDLVTLELVAEGFSAPVNLTTRPGEASPLFVVEQGGIIRTVREGTVDPTPFLDLTDRVGTGGERGLFALAFHPDHASNGYVFVHYTDVGGDTRVSRFRVTGDPAVVDPASETILLTVEQPFANHNGGHIAFGPDGHLYVALGDGGSGGDPQGNGQDRSTLLGALLRLDVDGDAPYVPVDNPFVDDPEARDEIWAFGLRNPWRFSFDRETGDLWIGDVGQNRREEIDWQPAGGPGGENYGWNVMEGTECYDAGECDRTGLSLPLHDYATGSDGTCSVTGGFVYRGSAIPDLRGRYLFADFCGGWVRALARDGDEVADVTTLLTGLARVTSFGEDGEGELYVLEIGGNVWRVAPAEG